MRKSLLIFVLFLITISFSVHAKRDYADDSIESFPVQPKDVKLHKMTGILEDYGVGKDDGGLLIKLPNGKEVDFTVGAGMRLGDDSIAGCWIPNYVKSDGAIEVNCSGWSNKFILEKTKVVVTYWYRIHYPTTTNTEDGTEIVDYKHYSLEKITNAVDLAK